MARVAIPTRVTNTIATVETYGGDGAYGPVYAGPVEVKVALSEGRRLVRDAAGDETVSEATIYANPQDRTHLQPESRVTIGGRSTRVLSVKVHQDLRGRPGMVEAVLA